VDAAVKRLRLLVDPPAAGARNMAVDEVLLTSAAEQGIATLRFYGWEVPTLSLGYFQRAADRELHASSLCCPLVRRASGGGAIVHDCELTYSIAMPLRDVRASAATELYGAFHETLIGTLARFGVVAALYGSTCDAGPGERISNSSQQPFLCFARRACGDIICGGAKIVGSSQRRRRGAVLQHGSILLGESSCAPELSGIAQLTGHTIEPGALAQAWTADLARKLGASAAPGEFTESEQERARFHAERFAGADHTYRR
jgi:lipoate-protein ligase A